VYGLSAEALMRMLASLDLAQARMREGETAVERMAA